MVKSSPGETTVPSRLPSCRSASAESKPTCGCCKISPPDSWYLICSTKMANCCSIIGLRTAGSALKGCLPLRRSAKFNSGGRERCRSVEQLEAAFAAALGQGHEGLLVKDPSSPYTPGQRGRYWFKLKRPLATLDVVVTAVEYGHGKRRGLLSDYTFAVRDEDRLIEYRQGLFRADRCRDTGIHRLFSETYGERFRLAP